MRVVVDLDLCGGFGVCQSEAPEVFRVVDDGGYAHVEVVLAEPPPPLHEKARSAARHCPNRVIRIVGE
ncbi:MAG: ferredoxin [Candidatus Binatia bacterium]